MVGTIVNVGAVFVGGTIGLVIKSHLPEKYTQIFFQAIGLVTIGIGISMAIQAQNILIGVLSLVIGSVAGEAIDIEKRLNNGADKLKKRISMRSERFSEAFVTASMLYCVGSMAILGSIEDGQGYFPRLLYTKSIMDGVTAIAIGATLGVGVLFSVIPMFIYQGLITVFAGWMSSVIGGDGMIEMTAVGGLLLIGMGIKILKIKDINVTNMLPSLLVALILGALLN